VDQANKIVEYILALGGFVTAGMVFLAMGYFVAQRKATVIVCAVLAGICAALQFALLLFVNSASQAWGGLWMAASALLTLASAAVIVMLTRRKLRAIREGQIPDPARMAAAWMAAYVLVLVLAPLINRMDDAFRALTNPAAWLAVGSGLAAIWGLSRRAQWGWWLAMLILALQLSMVSYSLLKASLLLTSSYGLACVLAAAVMVVLIRDDVRGVYLK
jgi:hypothetical protein